MLLPAFALLLGAFSGIKHIEPKEKLEPDNIQYEDPLVIDYDKPSFVQTKQAAKVSASSVKIHYHNEDGLCSKRAFWVWAPGVNGSQFAPTTVSQDGKDMELALTFTGENAMFAGKKGISFIIKMADSWAGQSENVEILYSEHLPDASGCMELWVIPGDGDAVEIYDSADDTNQDRVQLASFTDWKNIKVIATAVPTTYRLYALTASYMAIASVATREDLNKYLIVEGNTPACTDVTYNSIPSKQFTIKLNFTAKVNIQYYIEAVFPAYPNVIKTKYVNFTDLYETERFETYYTYDGNDLGATYIDNRNTMFKVWAPTAAKVRVLLYETGSPSDYVDYDPTASDELIGGYDMVFRPGGVWEVIITGKNLHASYYTYRVYNSLGINDVVDPYAKACGVDGKRGMIVDWTKTNPENWDNVPKKWDGVPGYDIGTPNELSIYETHIRDLTMDQTWTGKSDRGTYSAFIESGTKYEKNGKSVTTGFDHLTELGVKAVQLEPVFDSDNVESIGQRSYNWGYNPLNYNCVDGSYATNPYQGGARVKEFKSLVKAFAENGNKTRVIMDVVYNHVASAPSSNFHKLMPRYYFRYTENGNYWNGSGCGNDVKTEAPMMSKFIVDSLCFWASEYKIKGFRFDLMGLIDFETIKKAAQELYKIDPDIYLYGEGWTGDGQDAHMENQNPGDKYYGNWGSNTWTVYNKLGKTGNMCYVGAFNDAGRNALKGGNGENELYGFIAQDSGYVGNRSEAVADMMVGYHTGMDDSVKDPNMCINYASCHDNFTLFDQMTYTIGSNGTNDYPGLPCAATIACECAIMFSNGVAFIHGGEEVFRNKVVSAEDIAQYGYEATMTINGKTVSHNSYHLSDYTNSYKWDRKIEIDGVSTTEYVAELAKAIHLRSSLAKYSKSDLQAHSPYSSGSNLNVWNQGNGSTCIGMKNNNHFLFLAGCTSGEIDFAAYDDSGFNVQAFCSNPKGGGFSHPSYGKIKLGWATCVCLTNH